MSQDLFPTLLEELASCFQAYELVSGRHIRALGLTPSQYGIIVALGQAKDQQLPCGELGHDTLITKGTLTGVLDRLAHKKLIIRAAAAHDRRSIIIKLTDAGKILYTRIAKQHTDYLRPAFQSMDPASITALTQQLNTLRTTIDHYGKKHPPLKRRDL